jgi:hypothetical protein
VNDTSVDTAQVVAKLKTAQIQIRVSQAQKTAIQRAAKRAGMDMSNFVLSRVISVPATRFQECISAARGPTFAYGLAELNTLLTKFSASELKEAVASQPNVPLSAFTANYVAAMVELACAHRSVAVPHWTRAVLPLEDPWFASSVPTLRHYLLTTSPAPFRRRNIFIDSSLGSRV